jgi:hypothetical protein
MKDEDIAKLIPEDMLSDFATAFLQGFLKDGFGAASKRSTELHIFHLLDSYGKIGDLDNTKLSHLLQITETRVKSYRYESKLKFPPQEDKYVERRILWSLAKSEFDGDAKRIKFIVEDPYVRNALAAESKRLGGVPDSSFNREIVSLRTGQLLALISGLFGEKISNQFAKDFDELNKEDSKIKFSELRKKFVLGAAGALGGATVKSLKTFFLGDPT